MPVKLELSEEEGMIIAIMILVTTPILLSLDADTYFLFKVYSVPSALTVISALDMYLYSSNSVSKSSYPKSTLFQASRLPVKRIAVT